MDPRTLSVYGQEAARYAAHANAPAPRLAAFIAELPAGARVLDLGCGPGQDAAAMAEAGLKVEALDACAEMVALARMHSGVIARRARFEDLAANDAYDGIWAHFSLLHATRAELPGHLRRIRDALVPAGLFHIAVKTGSGEGRDKLGRFYTYWREDDLHRLLRTTGFTVIDCHRGKTRGLAGTLDPFVEIAARG